VRLLEFLAKEKKLDRHASVPELLRRARELEVVDLDESFDRTTVWRACKRLGLPLRRVPGKREIDARGFAACATRPSPRLCAEGVDLRALLEENLMKTHSPTEGTLHSEHLSLIIELLSVLKDEPDSTVNLRQQMVVRYCHGSSTAPSSGIVSPKNDTSWCPTGRRRQAHPLRNDSCMSPGGSAVRRGYSPVITSSCFSHPRRVSIVELECCPTAAISFWRKAIISARVP